jgi:hypothetical protein
MYHYIRKADNQGYYTDNPECIYDAIMKNTDDEKLAINVSAWCKNAVIGQSYNNPIFVIYIEDDDQI